MTFEQIKKEILSGKFAPIYYFYGDESFFIDQLTGLLEKNVLSPAEETFNKFVAYGLEAKAPKMLNELRSFPMMATRRLVMLKEAQRMSKTELDKLASYLENPVSSSVFVMTFKEGKKIDKRSKLFKSIQKNGVAFESKKRYERQTAQWIQQHIKEVGLSIHPEAIEVLLTYLGTNISLIASEIEKIGLYLEDQDSKVITREVVYEMTNIDKNYNVFELMNALGKRDHSKSHFIIHQMMQNLKDNPPVLIVFQLFQFFNRLAILQSKKLSSENDIASALQIARFIAAQYLQALRKYPNRKVQENLSHILEADLYLKGVYQTHMGQDHILKTLVYKLLN